MHSCLIPKKAPTTSEEASTQLKFIRLNSFEQKLKSIFHRRDLREECLTVLQSQGFRATQGSDAGRLKYLHIGRWLIRPRLFARFLISPHCRVADVARLRFKYFQTDGSVKPADMILIRDAVRPKVCLYFLEDGWKRVLMHYEYDFRREVQAAGIFEREGIPCLPLLSIDEEEHSFVQILVGDIFGRQLHVRESEAESLLVEMISKSAFQDEDLAHYFARGRQVIAAMSDIVASELIDSSENLMDAALSEASDAGVSTVPVLRCHGDFSLNNILRGARGEYYLIDFDRSFVATALFDAMYFGMGNGWSQQEIAGLLRKVLRACKREINLPDRQLFDLARALYAVDLGRYLHERLTVIENDRDRICWYSLGLMQAALRI